VVFLQGSNAPKNFASHGTYSWAGYANHDLEYGAQFGWAVRNCHSTVLRLLVEVERGRVFKGILGWFRGNPKTSFHSACSSGIYSMVLLRMLTNNHPGSDGTVLVDAARNGYSSVVDLILEHALDKWKDNQTAIQSALQASAERGHIAVVERLISTGAIPNRISTFDKPTALQTAAAGGHLAIVYRLLSVGADIDTRPSDSKPTPLQAASAGGYLAVIDRLLSAGADVNTCSPQTPLQAAVSEGHLAVVNRLLAAGAEVDLSPGHNAQTPLERASAGRHVAVVQRLLSVGANAMVSSTESSASSFSRRTPSCCSGTASSRRCCERISYSRHTVFSTSGD